MNQPADQFSIQPNQSNMTAKNCQQEDPACLVDFRILPRHLPSSDSLNAANSNLPILTGLEKKEMELPKKKEERPFPSLVANTANINKKNRIPKLSFKQIFRGSPPSGPTEDASSKAPCANNEAKAPSNLQMVGKSPSVDILETPVSCQREPSLPKKKHLSKQLVLLTFYDDKSSEKKKETHTITDQIPLQHSRALTAQRSQQARTSQGSEAPHDNEEFVQGASPPLSKKEEPNDKASKGKACKDVMESLLVTDDTNEGQVLVLQVQDGEAVEAVALGAPKAATPENGTSYVSYTERLFQEEASGSNAAVYSSSGVGRDENARKPENRDDGVTEIKHAEDESVSPNAPLFMSSSGEMANMANIDSDFPESMSTASATAKHADRYAPLLAEKKLVRFSTTQSPGKVLESDSTAESDHHKIDYSGAADCFRQFSQISVDSGQSTDSYDMQLLREEKDSNTAQAVVISDNHLRCNKESTGCSPPVIPVNSEININRPQRLLFEDSSRRSSDSADREWADLKERMRAGILLSKRSKCLAGGRDPSNISASSYVSMDSDYSSIDLESITSFATGTSTLYRKPLDIPVADELKDMANEFSKNPVVLMKWLNPS